MAVDPGKDAMKEFPCTQCGLCCQHVDKAIETRALDRGDGTCKHYNSASKHCAIYEQRPDICRIDRQYEINYAEKMSWEYFVVLNIQACEALQRHTGPQKW